MGRYLDVQPDGDPVEYTHFDCWKNDPHDSDDEPADFQAMVIEWYSILKNWSKGLKCQSLHDWGLYDDFYDMLFTLGFETHKDLVVLQLLKLGYDVYEGDGFIEIYKGE